MSHVHDVLNTPNPRVHDVLNTLRVHDVLNADTYQEDTMPGATPRTAAR